MLYLSGGADSWNVIVPKDGCTSNDAGVGLYEQYAVARGTGATGAAVVMNDLLEISPMREGAANTQPCDTFGVHPSFVKLKASYDEGDAAFLANVGTLIEPLTKDEFQKKQKRIPKSIGSHNTQTMQAQNVHSGGGLRTTGVLGRMLEALSTRKNKPFRVAPYSLSGNTKQVFLRKMNHAALSTRSKAGGPLTR